MLEMLIPDAILAGTELFSNIVGGFVATPTSNKKHTVANTYQKKNDIWEEYIKEFNIMRNSLNISEEEKDELNRHLLKMINHAAKYGNTIVITGDKK